MILSSNKRFFPLILALLLGFGLIGSVIHGNKWNLSEYITSLITFTFILYLGITNFMADRIELTPTHLHVKYHISGINWSKSWVLTDIRYCRYDGHSLFIKTITDSSYKLNVSVNATENEIKLLNIGDG